MIQIILDRIFQMHVPAKYNSNYVANHSGVDQSITPSPFDPIMLRFCLDQRPKRQSAAPMKSLLAPEL